MRLFAAFLLIITLTSASPTVDPGGWTKAKWEMRKAQLKLAFPLATDYESEDGKVFGLKDYLISKRHFEVTFAFAEDGGLHEVFITPAKQYFDPPSPPTDAATSHLVLEGAQGLFVESLTEKCGNPIALPVEHGERLDVRRRQWLFPTTRIEVSTHIYSNGTEPQLEYVSLDYRRRERSPQF